MRLIVSKPNENMIQYYDWKDGRSIKTSKELDLALIYAKECKLEDVEWLEKELYKRDANRGEYKHWTY